MANVKFPKSMWIERDEVEETKTTYLGDGSTVYTLGMMCYISAGTVVPVSTTAEALDTDAAPWSSAARYCIILEASAATSGYVNVAVIDENTLLGMFVVNTAGDTVTLDGTNKHTNYQLYNDATDRIALDAVTTKPLVSLEDVDVDTDIWSEDARAKDEDGVVHSVVYCKLLPALTK